MIQCSVCGRFCIPADEGVMYGLYCDYEEPDPDYFCERCAKAELEDALKPGGFGLIRCWWIKPDWYRMAHTILRRRAKEEGSAGSTVLYLRP